MSANLQLSDETGKNCQLATEDHSEAMLIIAAGIRGHVRRS